MRSSTPDFATGISFGDKLIHSLAKESERMSSFGENQLVWQRILSRGVTHTWPEDGKHYWLSRLAAVSTVTAQDHAALEEASKQIGQLFAQGRIPDEIAATISLAYAELGGGNLPVAVRSSATVEDLPELSFAGQQDTYLNIRGESQVLDAVKRCWASLWTARAIEYRMRHKIASEDVSLAVVVQALVPAEVAGILFTANPVNGARDQLVINAAWGLGEAIVGGLVTPDTFVVNRADGTVVSQEIHDKDVMTVRTTEGTREEPVPADRRSKAALSPTQAAELARVCALRTYMGSQWISNGC